MPCTCLFLRTSASAFVFSMQLRTSTKLPTECLPFFRRSRPTMEPLPMESAMCSPVDSLRFQNALYGLMDTQGTTRSELPYSPRSLLLSLWSDFVNWVLLSLMFAEEKQITQTGAFALRTTMRSDHNSVACLSTQSRLLETLERCWQRIVQ